jgi:hypothetical protein
MPTDTSASEDSATHVFNSASISAFTSANRARIAFSSGAAASALPSVSTSAT